MAKILKKIVRGEVRAGDELMDHVFNSTGQLLLRRGFLIENDRILQRVMEQGFHFTEEFLVVKRETQVPVITEKEHIPVLSYLSDLHLKLERLLSRTDQALFTDRLLSIVLALVEAIEGSSDTALAWILLNNDKQYAVRHVMHTAIVSYLVADRIGLSFEDKISTVCAALTMNYSMMSWQDKLHNDTHYKMNAVDRKRLEEHPQESANLLQKAGVLDTTWLSAVLYHHETFDGKGYPDKLKGDDIVIPAQILSITDWYTAILVDRPDRAAKQASDFLKDIFLERGRSVDSMLANAMIKILGIYPPGTKVKLASGDLGVVVRRGSTAQFPDVHAIVDSRGNIRLPIHRDSHHKDYGIVGVAGEQDHQFVIPQQLLWKETIMVG